MKLGRRREALQAFKAALSCDVEVRLCACARAPCDRPDARFVPRPARGHAHTPHTQDINALLGKMHTELLMKKLRRQERRQQRDDRRCGWHVHAVRFCIWQ
jgi:hypothetical protein